MFRNIISTPETSYLGFGLMMPWENNLEMQFNLWKEGFASGKIERLKEVCGSKQVAGIFCYKCDMETRTFSYHIACENKLNAISSEFEKLKLGALDYACFENECREHHLGKSEVCGLAGNPLQAFGLELVKRGFVVLAPDSICFEDRRRDPSVEGFDFWQHFDEMCYRILKGDYLMKKVLDDAMNRITLLCNLDCVDDKRIGTLGHSYGGNTVLFLSALDERIAFSCASGSACTYENRMLNNVGIEMASVIPNFHGKYDIYDLVSCIAPRRLLIVSGDDDKYSRDASYVVEKASPAYSAFNALQSLQHKRYSGGHALTKERFDAIIEWVVANG